MINFAVVIGLERHIESLLLHNDCVIVPELGGFVAHHVDARYCEEEHLFLPPARTLGFNPQLTMNDSLLVQSYAETYDISYPEALGRVEHDVETLRHTLDEEGHYELDGVGTLYKNQEGKLMFAPCESGTLTPSLYALDSFEMKPLEQAGEETNTATQSTTAYAADDEKTGQRKVSVSLKALRHAAVAACVLVFCLFAITPMGVQQPTHDYSVKSSMFSCLYDSQPREANPQPVKLTTSRPDTPQATPEKAASWTIVLCTHVPMSGAKAFREALTEQGYDGVRILTHEGSVKVVYGTYSSEVQARAALRSMKPDKYFNTAWVLHTDE